MELRDACNKVNDNHNKKIYRELYKSVLRYHLTEIKHHSLLIHL